MVSHEMLFEFLGIAHQYYWGNLILPSGPVTLLSVSNTETIKLSQIELSAPELGVEGIKDVR